jgi:hypothetical protein
VQIEVAGGSLIGNDLVLQSGQIATELLRRVGKPSRREGNDSTSKSGLERAVS